MKWLVTDTLYCPEQLFASHLDSYSHYLREMGQDVYVRETHGWMPESALQLEYDIAFVLDSYDRGPFYPVRKRIAQVAAICNPMPWDVRKPDGSPAYDLVISSIPWMVEAARAAGCRGEYQPLAFDTRARACGMGVKRDLGCVFIGTVGPNHKRRAELLEELKDVVTVLPPVFGREYFKALARAKVVLQIHAEWSRGAKNAMRIFEAAGMACNVISDGETPWMSPTEYPESGTWMFPCHTAFAAADGIRKQVVAAIADPPGRDADGHLGHTLRYHTYESRIPQIVEWARSL